MNNNEFYDNLSDDYDSMLNFNKLIESRKESLKKFIKFDYKNAIDIGCGTGADSIALTMNGLNVVGYDTSLGMIEKARINAKNRKLKIKFFNTPVQNLGYNEYNKLDIVVSLGNAIANISPKILNRIFKKVYKLLKPSGRLLIQILNYESVRKYGKRIVNITRGNENIYVRFYDFEQGSLRFNILTVKDKVLQDYNLITTELYEHKKRELKELLTNNGFTRIKYYSDFNKSKFVSKSSKDLIIIAEKTS